MNLFKNKTVLITGSTRGLGKALVEEFVLEGALVIAHARKKTAEFESYISNLEKKYNTKITPIYFDLSDEDEIKKAFKELFSSKTTIDILINNAAIPYGALMTMTPISKLREVFEINYFSQILIMQLCAKAMMKQKSGVIVNMASVGGIENTQGYLAYGSSKAALIWATKTISKELAPYNIRVNAVAPGLVKTDMGSYKNEDELAKTIKRTSLKRMAEPKEIVNAVKFIASDESSFMTGSVINVDGGRL